MLLILLALPFVVSVILMVMRTARAREIALGTSLFTLLISLWMLAGFDSRQGEQFVTNLVWLPGLGISFSLAADGISLLLILLTTVLTPMIILSSFQAQRPESFYGLILLMEAALMGVFVARDGFLFYVFWEMALIPIWFICLLWGEAGNSRVVLKFFLYTLAGSLFMLLGLLYLYLSTPAPHSFLWIDLLSAGRALPATTQSFVFWALFIAFAIKMPILPFHTWQPETYRTAPAQGSMLLSGIMLKMGIYGVIRWLLPLVPLGTQEWGTTALTLSILGVVYASMIAMMQRDVKRLIAYSSIAHVGLISAGVFTLTKTGLQGAVLQMVSHGLVVFGLFYVAEIVFDRTGKRSLNDLGGIRHAAPKFATVFMILVLGSVGLPLTSGFVGEVLLITSVVKWYWLAGLLGGLTIILGATYMLRAYKAAMLGEAKGAFADLTTQEKMILYPLVILILALGVFPGPWLQISDAASQNLLQLFENINAFSQLK